MVVILLIGVAVGILLINQQSFFRLRAEGPDSIYPRTTNITDTSFTITWTTSEPTNGFVRWNTKPSELNRIAVDERNLSSHTHSITLHDLEPHTTYYYVIATNGSLYGQNGSTPIAITTAANALHKSIANTIFGKVVTRDGKPVVDALIYIETEEMSPISTKTDKDGGWVVALSNARSKDLSSFIELTPENIITLKIIDGKGLTRDESLQVSEAKPTQNILLY